MNVTLKDKKGNIIKVTINMMQKLYLERYFIIKNSECYLYLHSEFLLT